MSLTKLCAISTVAVLAVSLAGCRQFKELVNEEPKAKTAAQAQQNSVQEENQPLILQDSTLNDVERAEIEAMYGDREAERKARRKRVFGF